MMEVSLETGGEVVLSQIISKLSRIIGYLHLRKAPSPATD